MPQPDEPTDAAPDALAPNALLGEITNIIFNQFKATNPHGGRDRAEVAAMGVIEKLMEYYSAVAAPELTQDTNTIMLAVAGLDGAANSVIRLGARNIEFLNADERATWQRSAERLRQHVAAILALLT